MTGITPAGTRSKLYLNNGSGNFTETTTILTTDVSSSVTIFKDLDGDNDLDLFFSGNRNIGGAFTHIYSNNGSGGFTLINNPVLTIFIGDGVYWNTSTTLSVTDLIASNQGITFYPNPTNDFVHFNLNEKIGSIVLFNLLGQGVFAKQVNAKEFILDISNLSGGTYVAKVNADNKSQSVKLIKM
jgi:hypothetical protein